MNEINPGSIGPIGYVDPPSKSREQSPTVKGMTETADMTPGKNPLDKSPFGTGYRLLDHPELTKQIHGILKER